MKSLVLLYHQDWSYMNSLVVKPLLGQKTTSLISKTLESAPLSLLLIGFS